MAADSRSQDRHLVRRRTAKGAVRRTEQWDYLLGEKSGQALFLLTGDTAFVVAYLSVAWFMGWVRKRGFVPFAIYRIIAGVLVLVLANRLVA